MILGPLQNHLRITGIDHLARPVILENDLQIDVFLAAVLSAVASRFKDPAKVIYLATLCLFWLKSIWVHIFVNWGWGNIKQK